MPHLSLLRSWNPFAQSRRNRKSARSLHHTLAPVASIEHLENRTLLAAAGTLDSTFDADGRVTTSVGLLIDQANAVAVQSDGKSVVAGFTVSGLANLFAVARYNANGSLDTTFGGGDGIVTIQFSALPTGIDQATSLAIQPDGKIVVAGLTLNVLQNDIAIARLNADGSMDTSFDGDGKVTTGSLLTPEQANGVAVQSDGKIVVVGFSGSTHNFTIVRYNANGSIDTSFSGDGIATPAISIGTSEAKGVVIQPNGKIVATGFALNGLLTDIATVRLNTDGTLDSIFDGDGIVLTNVGLADEGHSVALQQDGKIVVAGFTVLSGLNNDFALVRYNTNGSLDTTFDGDGLVTTDFGLLLADVANGIAIQSDGKIVAAGIALNVTNNDFALARYNADGSLDSSFGGDGRVLTEFTPLGLLPDEVNGVAIQPDGKIVAAGWTLGVVNNDFAVARYVASNQAPVFNAIPDHTVAVGNTLTFTVSATDPDGDPLTYSASNLPTGATFDPGTQTFTWTPTASQGPGDYTVVFTADDGVNPVQATADIAVTGGVNNAPVLTPIGDKTVAAGANLSFTVSATDTDGDPLTFAASGLPAGATFNPTTHTFSWTPTAAQGGAHDVTFTVSDGKTTDAETISINVTGGNAPPVFNDIPPQTVAVSEQLTFTVTANDPDGDPITYAASNLPAGATFNAGTHTFTWTPSAAQGPGEYAVVFTATAGGQSAIATADILVTGGTNDAPVLAPIGDKSVPINTNLTFTVSATDADGESITFAAVNLPAGAIFNPATHVFTWTPTAAQVGSYEVTFTASDGKLTDAETITISVTGGDQPPVFSNVPPQTVPVNTPLTFTVSATDPDGDPLTYSADDLPPSATFDPGTQTFTWTPTTTQGPGEYTVTFTASDGVRETMLPVEITVTGGTNNAPTFSPVGDQTVNAGGTVTFTVSASDPDGDPLTYSASNLPPGAVFIPATHTFTWPTTLDEGPGSYPVMFTVTDGKLPVSQQVVVTVVGGTNHPPVLGPLPDANIERGDTLVITLPASDPDGDTLTFSSDDLPPNATLDPNTGVFTFTPSAGQSPLCFDITFTVSDGGLNNSQTLMVMTTVDGQGPGVRLFRAYNHNNVAHFFTTSQAEFENAVAHGFDDETSGRGGIGVMSTPLTVGALPLHRMYNPNTGEHYYTIDSNERDFLVSKGWNFEKDEGYVSLFQEDCMVQIYRLYNNVSGTHLYTESAGVRDKILADFPGIWFEHAPLGFAYGLGIGEGFPPGSSFGEEQTSSAVSAESSRPVQMSSGDSRSNDNTDAPASNSSGSIDNTPVVASGDSGSSDDAPISNTDAPVAVASSDSENTAADDVWGMMGQSLLTDPAFDLFG